MSKDSFFLFAFMTRIFYTRNISKIAKLILITTTLITYSPTDTFNWLCEHVFLDKYYARDIIAI